MSGPAPDRPARPPAPASDFWLARLELRLERIERAQDRQAEQLRMLGWAVGAILMLAVLRLLAT
ncbi:MAG: hypothetical protein ACU0BF_11345 [Paracoccaceae bacterium]